MQFSRKIDENSKFCYKVLNIGISPTFFAYKKGKWYSNIPCKFQLHSMRILYLNGDINFYGVAITLPIHPDFNSLSYHHLCGIPKFFSSKWKQRMNLKLLKCPGSVSFAKKSIGVVTTPFCRHSLIMGVIFKLFYLTIYVLSKILLWVQNCMKFMLRGVFS